MHDYAYMTMQLGRKTAVMINNNSIVTNRLTTLYNKSGITKLTKRRSFLTVKPYSQTEILARIHENILSRFSVRSRASGFISSAVVYVIQMKTEASYFPISTVFLTLCFAKSDDRSQMYLCLYLYLYL